MGEKAGMDMRESLLQSLDNTLKLWDTRPWKVPYKSKREKIIKLCSSKPKASISKLIIHKTTEMIIGKNIVFPITARTFFGERMRIFTMELDLWSWGLLGHPSEIRLTKFFINNMVPGDVFYDIGSHHGYYSLLAHKILGNHGEIHAFEPTEIHFKLAKQNLRDKDNVCINKLALYSAEGQLKFYQHIHGSSTFNKTFFDKTIHKTDKFSEIEVTTTTLDKYCQTKNIRPTFMKLDVEGAEYDVLLGGQRTLRTCSPKIVMEVWRSPFDYANHLKAIDYLLSNNYRPFKINENGIPEEVPEIVPDRDIAIEENVDNFLFMKS